MTEVTEEDHELVSVTVFSHYRKNRSNYIRKGYEVGDLFGIAYEALLLAKQRHDPSKSPLHYFQRIYIRGYLLNALNRNTPQTVTLGKWGERTPDDNPDIYDVEREHQLEEAREARDLVLKYAESDRDVLLVKLVYIDGLSRHEAAKVTDMQYGYSTRRMRTGLEKIREFIEGDTSRLERRCLDCDTNINDRHPTARLCVPCHGIRQKQAWLTTKE